MDRSAEFKAEVNLLARNQGGMHPRNASNHARQRRHNNKDIVAFLEFSQLARMIGKDISDVHGKLQKLKTCKCYVLSANPCQLCELTHSIKKDLSRLNAQTGSLQQHVRAAAAKGNRSTRQIDEHSGNVVIILQSKLANISMGFKEALEARSASVEASKKRQEQLLTASTGTPHPPSLSPSQSGSSLSSRSSPGPPSGNVAGGPRRPSASPIPHHLQTNPLHQHLQNGGGSHGRSASPFLVPATRASPPAHLLSEDGTSAMYNSSTSTSIHRRKAANYRSSDPNGAGYEDESDASGPASMLYHQQQYAPQDQAQNRSAAIEAVESTLQELGGIFQQLAQMVAEQRETVQRIEANTEDIEVNIGEAQTQLLRYYRNISSDRWMMIKIFLTIIFVFLVVSLVS
ncbi:cis-Golgi t-SNARE syntaxin [Actinomortierella ambigua]|nr:cis-Golgi t-SNARE syntaxin [Actinomortierella ambigua]